MLPAGRFFDTLIDVEYWYYICTYKLLSFFWAWDYHCCCCHCSRWPVVFFKSHMWMSKTAMQIYPYNFNCIILLVESHFFFGVACCLPENRYSSWQSGNNWLHQVSISALFRYEHFKQWNLLSTDANPIGTMFLKLGNICMISTTSGCPLLYPKVLLCM